MVQSKDSYEVVGGHDFNDSVAIRESQFANGHRSFNGVLHGSNWDRLYIVEFRTDNEVKANAIKRLIDTYLQANG